MLSHLNCIFVELASMFHMIFITSRHGFPNNITLFSNKAAGLHLWRKNVILNIIDEI